jgi:uncharacterized protein (DUF58 family)
MAYTYRQEMTKFDYCICLAAALGYLMIHQQDPVGLVTYDTRVRTSLPPRSKRTQLGAILAVLANLKPSEKTDTPFALNQFAALLKTKSLVMLFSDLLNHDAEPFLQSLYRLRHGGHEVIVFHVLDEAEVQFPFEGNAVFEDPETGEVTPPIDAKGIRDDYRAGVAAYREHYRVECAKANVDYVPMDTSVNFDKALLEYLVQRQRRF